MIYEQFFGATPYEIYEKLLLRNTYSQGHIRKFKARFLKWVKDYSKYNFSQIRQELTECQTDNIQPFVGKKTLFSNRTLFGSLHYFQKNTYLSIEGQISHRRNNIEAEFYKNLTKQSDLKAKEQPEKNKKQKVNKNERKYKIDKNGYRYNNEKDYNKECMYKDENTNRNYKKEYIYNNRRHTKIHTQVIVKMNSVGLLPIIEHKRKEEKGKNKKNVKIHDKYNKERRQSTVRKAKEAVKSFLVGRGALFYLPKHFKRTLKNKPPPLELNLIKEKPNGFPFSDPINMQSRYYKPKTLHLQRYSSEYSPLSYISSLETHSLKLRRNLRVLLNLNAFAFGAKS